ncbi:MAG: sigma-70 family RNA polymerase sigma factor [Actinomycetes bacterium]
MGVAGGVEDSTGPVDGAVESLIPIVRRIVRARVSDPSTAEDLVQETLVKVLAKANRVDHSMLEAYAIVTARNVVRTMWTQRDRQRRNQHRALDLAADAGPDEQLMRNVDAEAVSQALSRLTEDERALYEDLVTDAFGQRVRLEQEVIDWGWVRARSHGSNGGRHSP